VFSAVREARLVSDEYLDRLMTEWLRRLGAQRRVLH